MAGATLEFTFKNEEVQAMARRFREQLARVRFRPLLAAIGNELVTSVSHRFETGTAPDGSRWPESLRARLTGGQTLIKSGRLRDSIAETGPQLTARSVEVGTNVVYAAIHQFGGIIPPTSSGHGGRVPCASPASASAGPSIIPAAPSRPGRIWAFPIPTSASSRTSPRPGCAKRWPKCVHKEPPCLTSTGPPSRPI